jgi:hypothetical protein
MFQTQYFSENLVEPGIETGLLDLTEIERKNLGNR